jgi:hypothetical protein
MGSSIEIDKKHIAGAKALVNSVNVVAGTKVPAYPMAAYLNVCLSNVSPSKKTECRG